MNIQTRPDPTARARELGPEIAAAADEIERTRRVHVVLLGRLHDSRLFRMLLPRSAGGEETEPAVYVAAIEELARHDGSVAWNAFVANSSSILAAYLEPAANHAIFADSRSTIAWGPRNGSRARAVEGGYRVTGRWPFASGCQHADYIVGHGVVVKDGVPQTLPDGSPDARLCYMPADRCQIVDTWTADQMPDRDAAVAGSSRPAAIRRSRPSQSWAAFSPLK